LVVFVGGGGGGLLPSAEAELEAISGVATTMVAAASSPAILADILAVRDNDMISPWFEFRRFPALTNENSVRDSTEQYGACFPLHQETGNGRHPGFIHRRSTPPRQDGATDRHPEGMSMGTRLAGRYELLHPVWRDDLGTTFIARDEAGLPVSLRVLPATLAADHAVRRRFHDDERLLRSLRHPNLAAVLDLVVSGDVLAIASDAVPGRTLRHRLRTSGRLTSAEIAGIRQGLSALREAGLPRQPPDPGAVIFADTGEVRLADIAVPRLLDDSALGRGLLRASARRSPPVLSSVAVSVRAAARALVRPAAFR
jgi:serine/threonine protein kinase